MTLNEYVDLTLQVIRTNRHPVSGYITAAKLGLALGSTTATSWTEFGFLRLKNFLEYLQNSGHVTLTTSEKGALGVIEKQASAPPSQSELPLSRSFNPLRKPIWAAFTMESTRGLRFFSRVDGSVRFGLVESPKPVDEWVRIDPISPSEQKEWARAFLRDKQITAADVRAALDQGNWYHAFVAALEGIDHPTAAAWNRFRSNKVSETVRGWSTKNSISPDLIFLSKANRQSFQPKVVPPSGVLPELLPEDQKRSIVLAALNGMSTDELLDFPIPARLLLDAIAKAGAFGLKN
jgi:hypothetical protein